MISRDFHSALLTDSWVTKLTPVERMLYICCHFTEKVILLFCFQYPTSLVLMESGATEEEYEAFKVKAEAANKIRFKGEYIYLVNAHRFESLSGPKIESGRRSAFRRLPQEIQDWYNQLSPNPISLDTPIEINTPIAPLPAQKSAPKPETKPAYLEDISDEVAQKFAEKYNQSIEVVKREAFKCVNNHLSKNTKITDWNRAFHTWMSRGYDLQETKSEVPFTDLSHLGNARIERRNY